MPELPEVDAIAGVARKYAPGGSIEKVEVLRGNGKYLGVPKGNMDRFKFAPGTFDVTDVFRLGKVVVFETTSGAYMVVHNAMTGYFDWEHEPWTFDYVEGKRKATGNDVRVLFRFVDGKALRFHDARLFGSIRMEHTLPQTPPELMATPNGVLGVRIMTLQEFYQGLQVRTPVKVRLMDQTFVGGVGNIYASESCHLAGIDPRRSSDSLHPEEVSVLHASLVWSMSNCIPQVRYDWLKVYRRTSCMTCGKKISKVKLGGRSTSFCEGCQPP